MASFYKSVVSINDVKVPFVRWTTTHGAYGSAGTCEVTFSRHQLLDELDINLVEMARASAEPIEVSIEAPALIQSPRISVYQTGTLVPGIAFLPTPGIAVPVPISVIGTTVFGGYLDVSETDPAEDTVTVPCRDWSSLLLDSSIVAGSFKNPSVRALAVTFAEEAGLNTTDFPEFVQDTDHDLGYYLQRDHVQTSAPTTKWELLQKLARDAGFVCFTTPEKQLYFAPPNVRGLPPREYGWGRDLKELKIRHSPRKNRSFRVVVNSYHPKLAKRFRSIAVGNGLGKQLANVPIYEFYEEGLTQAQCDVRAKAIAADIARREIVITASISGDGGLRLWDGGLVIKGIVDPLPEIEGQVFNFSSITHTYEVPQGEADSGGFMTSFSAWNLLNPESVSDE